VTTLFKPLSHTVLCPLSLLHKQLLGSGFQRRIFPALWVPEITPCHSYQLLTATAHKDSTAAFTHSPTNSLHFTQLHSLIVLLKTSMQGPHRKHRSCHILHCWKRSHRRRQCRKHHFPACALTRVRNLLPSNVCCLQNPYLATGLDAAITTCVKWCCYLDVNHEHFR
jgi:hypothetical protein